MSQENVELVRRAYARLPDTLTKADDPAIEPAFGEVVDENFELRLPSDYPDGEHVFIGLEGRNQMAAWLRESWAEFRTEPERFIDAGDRVVVFIKLVARSHSGVPVELSSGAQVVTVRDGRVASIRGYRDRSEALKAVGLEE